MAPKNPPAFPVQERLQGDGEGSWLSPGQSGMSLRDYFAGQALHALITYFLSDAYNGDNVLEAAAGDAYRLADLVLAEREKGSHS